MTCYLGVDPGMTGGFALVVDGELFDIRDMPVVAKQVSPALVADIVGDFQRWNLVAVVEQVASMPGNGVAGMFRFGVAYGVILGVTATIGYPIVHVRPNIWKKAMGLSADKGRSRRMACDRWPLTADVFARVKDDGRAEAALLAAWYTDQRGGV